MCKLILYEPQCIRIYLKTHDLAYIPNKFILAVVSKIVSKLSCRDN